MKAKKPMSRDGLREELAKVMPGYRWVIRRRPPFVPEKSIAAEGTLSSGFNRLSTIRVQCDRLSDDFGRFWVTARLWDGIPGKRDLMAESAGLSVAQALRSLQESVRRDGQRRMGQAATMERARS